MMSRKRDVGKAAHMEASRYTSDIFSLVSFTLSPDDSLCKNNLEDENGNKKYT